MNNTETQLLASCNFVPTKLCVKIPTAVATPTISSTQGTTIILT